MHNNYEFSKGQCVYGIFFLSLLMVLGVGCSSSSSSSVASDTPDFSGLVDIQVAADNPTDLFFLDSTGFAKLSRTSPFKGSNSTCSHTGAHVHFTNDEAPYTVDLIAPVDGVITEVTTCQDIGESDRYGINMAVANSGSQTVELKLSIEPQDGHLCSDADDDPDYFATYIDVVEGQAVTRGQVIGQFLKTDNGDDAAHVHFALGYYGEHDLDICPNIFAASVVSQITALYSEDTCNGTLPTDSLCFQTTDEEMIIEE